MATLRLQDCCLVSYIRILSSLLMINLLTVLVQWRYVRNLLESGLIQSVCITLLCNIYITCLWPWSASVLSMIYSFLCYRQGLEKYKVKIFIALGQVCSNTRSGWKSTKNKMLRYVEQQQQYSKIGMFHGWKLSQFNKYMPHFLLVMDWQDLIHSNCRYLFIAVTWLQWVLQVFEFWYQRPISVM